MWVAINFLCIFINSALSVGSFSLSTFTPYPSLKYCGFKPKDSIAHIFWYTAGIKEGISLLIIVLCYLRIAYHYHSYLSEIGNGSAKFTGQFDPKQDVEEAKIVTRSRLILDYNIVEHSVKSSIKRVYIIVTIYVIEFMIIIGVQTTYKMLGTLPNTIIDIMLSLVTNLIPITNSLFILFFHDETNQELKNLLARRGC
ncbi:hypothetical protein CONCODRAFT_10110 [Conidiobolus coronatus NRRL 28638]|uniref:G-protein coupled receptors family 1 profile domain-containing protein n=1 Tax=Conidiobolus coronatus (strain ATCC 28846 / CBS 209.66 / NRRL 28638) TaxID=796925 RepID=A0A137NY02_CONC2|nr:hypothetical protein CONCODRAFT_10110 [Conidiobolus coronatus NRRL 28638]|eukprot:KXN67753.1 hypothetical protein CONCODRAFT_10110 [Conidiobolus coronatus NRRL 28638]